MSRSVRPDASDVVAHLRRSSVVLIEHRSWSRRADELLGTAFAFDSALARAVAEQPTTGHLIRLLPYDAPPGSSADQLKGFDEWLDVATLTSQLTARPQISVHLCTDMRGRPRDVLLSGEAALRRYRSLAHAIYPRAAADWTDTDFKDADPFWILDVT